MSIALIGSRALALRWNEIKRTPKDFDFVATPEECDLWIERFLLTVPDPEITTLSEKKKVIKTKDFIAEFDIALPGSNAEKLLELISADSQTKKSSLGLIPSLDMLFTLKASHRYQKNDPHWWKTLLDYHTLKSMGAKIRPEWMDWFRWRERETYVFRTPKLMGVKKDEFFDPSTGVNYVYDHDSIHVAIKKLEKPAYRYFMKDGADVACDRDKFMNLPKETQLLSVLEESYVLAIERSQVPFAGKITPRNSFRIAFSKVLSSITSGWWREWGYENAPDVLKMYSDSYIDTFNDGIARGIVKPFKGDSNPYK